MLLRDVFLISLMLGAGIVHATLSIECGSMIDEQHMVVRDKVLTISSEDEQFDGPAGVRSWSMTFDDVDYPPAVATARYVSHRADSSRVLEITIPKQPSAETGSIHHSRGQRLEIRNPYSERVQANLYEIDEFGSDLLARTYVCLSTQD